MESKRYGAAVFYLERCVVLKPKRNKYATLLSQATHLAAQEETAKAVQVPPTKPSTRLGYINEALKFKPDYAPALQLMADIEALLAPP